MTYWGIHVIEYTLFTFLPRVKELLNKYDQHDTRARRRSQASCFLNAAFFSAKLS